MEKNLEEQRIKKGNNKKKNKTYTIMKKEKYQSQDPQEGEQCRKMKVCELALEQKQGSELILNVPKSFV